MRAEVSEVGCNRSSWRSWASFYGKPIHSSTCPHHHPLYCFCCRQSWYPDLIACCRWRRKSTWFDFRGLSPRWHCELTDAILTQGVCSASFLLSASDYSGQLTFSDGGISFQRVLPWTFPTRGNQQLYPIRLFNCSYFHRRGQPSTHVSYHWADSQLILLNVEVSYS